MEGGKMKYLCTFFVAFCVLLFAAEPNTSPVQWQTFTPLVDNDTPLFRFQMPGIPEEICKDNVYLWKTEAEGNCFFVVIPHPHKSCCNFPSFMHSVIPENYSRIFLWREKEAPNFIGHGIFKDSAGKFYHVKIYINDRLPLMLVTKTSNEHSPEHQRFIESFTFLDE